MPKNKPQISRTKTSQGKIGTKAILQLVRDDVFGFSVIVVAPVSVSG